MIGYQMVGTSDLEKSLAFYDEVIAIVGGKRAMPFPNGQGYGFAEGPLFAVTKPYDEQAATAGNGSMTAFRVDSSDKVSAAHAKALELGGTCEGEPGPRGEWGDFAYSRDLDGNKIAVFCMKQG